MSDYLNKIRSFNRDVLLFLVTPALIGFTVFGGIYTVLFNLFLVRLGYGPEFIGTVNASSQLAIALVALPASIIGSRLGARRAMIWGMGIVTLGHALPPLAEFVPVPWRQGWILLTYLSGGIGFALHFVNSSPWVMSVTQPQERYHVFSLQAALWPLAGFVGSLIGGVMPTLFADALGLSLNSPAPYRYPLLIAAGLLVISVVTMCLTRPTPVTPRTAPRFAIAPATPLAIIVLMALVGILRGTGEGAARTFFNVYMDTRLGVSAAQIGVFLALGQLLSVPAALLTPVFAARWGTGRSIMASVAALALVMLPLALVPHWLVAGLSFMGMLVMVAVARPAYMVYSQEIVAPHWQGAMSAATTMAIGISWGLIAFGGGYVIAGAGYRALFVIGVVLTALGALLFWGYFRTPRGEFTPNAEISKSL